MKESTTIKLCKRATKCNPKSVVVAEIFGCKTRYLKTHRGVYRVEFDCINRNEVSDVAIVPYVGWWSV